LTKYFFIGAICFLVGGITMSGFPPFDPSCWLMMFGLGMIFGTMNFTEENND
jgi:hypothetical protein